MVRTRANNCAARKAVVAKAPRKQLAPAHSSSPSGKSKKGSKHSSGGNPAKVWPTPAWQKGIADFLAGEGSSGSRSPVDADAVVGTSADPLSPSSSESAAVCSQDSEPRASEQEQNNEREEEEGHFVRHSSDDESED